MALAYHLQKLGVRYDLFECENQVGGLIKSETIEGYQLELGAQGYQENEELQELIRELKLEAEVVKPTPLARNLFVLKEGKPQGLPHSPMQLLVNSFFGWRTKLRIAQEMQQPVQNLPNETVRHFFERRFGPEVVEELVRPLVASLYAGEPNTLLLEKTFPWLKELEKKHGSVLKGISALEEAEMKPLHTLQGGLQTLPKAIASKLISLHLDHKVEMVHRARGKYLLSIQHDMESLGEVEFDAVALALPAHAAAELMEFAAPGWAAALQNVSYAPLTVVHTAYPKPNVNYNLHGLGAMQAAEEQTGTVGMLWRSSVFPAAAPETDVLFTSFSTETLPKADSHKAERQIQQRIDQELQATYGIKGEKPLFQHAHHWPNALPQPDMFMLDVDKMSELVEQDRLYACAGWVAGFSISGCVRHAKQLAQKIYSRRTSMP